MKLLHAMFAGILVLAASLLSALAAEEPVASPTAKSSPQPTPIPLSDIASEAESTLRTIQGIATSISTDQVTATVEENLPPLTREIDLRGAEMAKFLTGIVPPELLNSMEIVLERYGEQLSTWNQELTERAKTLASQVTELAGLSERWQATLKLPELSVAAPEIPQRVQSLIESIAQIRQETEALRQKDFSLQGQVLQAATRLQSVAPGFQRAQANAVGNVFTQDSVSIWKLGGDQWNEILKTALIPPASVALFEAYLERGPFILYLHAGLILFFALLLLRLRRGQQKWLQAASASASHDATASVSADQSAGSSLSPGALTAFASPVSAAIALSFLLVGWLYSTAPFLARAVLWGILLIAITIILRRLIDRRLFPLLSGLIVLYFVDQFRLLASLQPPLGRLVSAAEMLAATWFLIWFTRRNRWHTRGAATSKFFAQVIRWVTRIGLIVFPLTLLANVLGYVRFANLLGGGAIRSAYVAVVMYAGLRIVEELITISLITRPASMLRAVRLNRALLQPRIYRLAGFLVFLYWASLTLSFFGLRTPLVTSAKQTLQAGLAVGTFRISLQQVLIFLLTAWAALAISKFLRFLLEEDIYYHWKLARGIPQAISTIVHYAVLLIGFFVGLAVLGVDLTKVTILAGAFTVGVGFGLQTVINNFVCGLILLFERPIKVGDIVQIDTDIGEVRRIGIRACVIRTTEGSEVIVPNSAIISNKVTNWTLSGRDRAIEVPVTVARGVSPLQMMQLLKQVAAAQPGISKEPAPEAHVVGFGAAAVSYSLRAWTDHYEDWVKVRSDLAVAVDAALMRENIPVA
jgi:potassium-dependent mechanosensitive channel